MVAPTLIIIYSYSECLRCPCGFCGHLQVPYKENHQLKEAVVRSNAGGDCVIKYADQTISFKTVKGRSYQIGYDAAKGLIKK